MRVAAHGWKSADGLPESSNCYCLPGRAGGLPLTLEGNNSAQRRPHDAPGRPISTSANIWEMGTAVLGLLSGGSTVANADGDLSPVIEHAGPLPCPAQVDEGRPKAAKRLLVHQVPELPGKVRTNRWQRIVALILQGSENFFSGAAPPRSGQLKSFVEGSVGWGWHGVFRRSIPNVF